MCTTSATSIISPTTNNTNLALGQKGVDQCPNVKGAKAPENVRSAKGPARAARSLAVLNAAALVIAPSVVAKAACNSLSCDAGAQQLVGPERGLRVFHVVGWFQGR